MPLVPGGPLILANSSSPSTSPLRPHSPPVLLRAGCTLHVCLPACLRGRRGLEAVGRPACVVAPFWNPPAALQPASWHRVVPALHRLLTCDLPLPTASPPHPRCMPSPPCGALPPPSADVSPCLHCPTAIPTFPCGAFPRVLGQKKTTTVLVIHASARASPAPSSFQPLLPPPPSSPSCPLSVRAQRSLSKLPEELARANGPRATAGLRPDNSTRPPLATSFCLCDFTRTRR